jgi:hypothetical protein
MAAATYGVFKSPDTHIAALLLLSAAIVSAGLVAAAVHYALNGFLGQRDGQRGGPLSTRVRDQLLRDKGVVLRSLKELEFDRAMGKVGDDDFAALDERLRDRALSIMTALERSEGQSEPELVAVEVLEAPNTCVACRTAVDADARFCKHCGAPVR